MINKKNLWFLTLFSLVLVLSIYYVTMPSEIFDSKLENEKVDKSTVNVEESTVISALKVEDENEVKEKKVSQNSNTIQKQIYPLIIFHHIKV